MERWRRERETWEDQDRAGWKLDLDDVKEIWRSYDKLNGCINAIAKTRGYSKATVYKYLNELSEKLLEEVQSYDDAQIVRAWGAYRRRKIHGGVKAPSAAQPTQPPTGTIQDVPLARELFTLMSAWKLDKAAKALESSDWNQASEELTPVANVTMAWMLKSGDASGVVRALTPLATSIMVASMFPYAVAMIRRCSHPCKERG